MRRRVFPVTLVRMLVCAVAAALVMTCGLTAAPSAQAAQAAARYVLKASGAGVTTTDKAKKLTVTFKKGRSKVAKATVALQYRSGNKWITEKKVTVTNGTGSVAVHHSVMDRTYRFYAKGEAVSASFVVHFIPSVDDYQARVLAAWEAGKDIDKTLAKLKTASPSKAVAWKIWVDTMAKLEISTTAPPIPKTGHCFVVLGSALTAAGKMSTTFERRLKVALALAEVNTGSEVLVSGGKPKSGMTEGELGRQWLIDHGLPATRVLAETGSSTTVANAVNSVKIAKKQGFTTLTLVSDWSQLRRAQGDFAAAKLESGWAGTLTQPVAYKDAETSATNATVANWVAIELNLTAELSTATQYISTLSKTIH